MLLDIWKAYCIGCKIMRLWFLNIFLIHFGDRCLVGQKFESGFLQTNMVCYSKRKKMDFPGNRFEFNIIQIEVKLTGIENPKNPETKPNHRSTDGNILNMLSLQWYIWYVDLNVAVTFRNV